MFYLIILIWFVSSQQDSQKITEISNYFSDLKIACKHNENVWGKNLYGPILFVERSDRTVYANRNTDSGLLKKNGSIFTGKLPDEINLANTAVEWNGRRWAMIMLPISTDKQKRINLMAHELFHLWQPDFGFKSFNPDLKHLDQKNGRIYLRLETEALKQAALKPDEAEKHLRNALTFRSYRNQLYPMTDSLENLLELNEGICEFTGQELSGRTEQERLENFIKRIDYFVSTPSYLRSFAYETIPVYGYFLKQLNSDWYRKITTETNLADLFRSAFHSNQKQLSEHDIIGLANAYNGNEIRTAENKREAELIARINLHKTMLISGPHLTIPFEQMNMSFDYQLIFPLEDYGTVYPQIRISDNWGILEVEKSSLINPNWSSITVSKPLKLSEKMASGDGWTLTLNTGYKIESLADGNFRLKKMAAN